MTSDMLIEKLLLLSEEERKLPLRYNGMNFTGNKLIGNVKVSDSKEYVMIIPN